MAAGDDDSCRITATESDSTCECCDFFCSDEDYPLKIALTAPADAGSYTFSIGSSRSGVDDNCIAVLPGRARSWIRTLDGGCGPTSDTYVC